MPQKKLLFSGKLFPFQEDVLKWTHSVDRGIVGLEMGLGKTVITLAMICQKNYRRTVIALPLQIIEQWKNSLLKFTNLKEKDIAIYQGPKRKSLNLLRYRVILTTYDVIRMDMPKEESVLAGAQEFFDCVILDEAHKIRNKKTQTYRSCDSLSKDIDAKWLLTGTTIHNKFSDFLTLCEFLKVPDANLATFRDVDKSNAWKKKYYYRLTKAQSGLDLPEKSIHEHWLKFDEAHADDYQTLLEETKEMYDDYLAHPTQVKFNFLITKILRLRQCCNHIDAHLDPAHYRLEKNRHDGTTSAKFTKIIEIINQSPKDDKIIIFSQWSHSLDLLAKQLDWAWIDGYDSDQPMYLQYNGTMDIGEKNQVLEDFRDGPQKVLLITLTSGGVGLDMSFANHIILMDSWWNPALEEQAIDRVYRIGQKKKVDVHRLYMTDTIEHWMEKMKEEKRKVDLQFHKENLVYMIDQMFLKKILHQYV
jgi:SNF2 family DNA or RNA helicase